MRTFTHSTQSMFKCSGIVVIHSPFVDLKNIPFSAANHMSYSPKFCKSKYWISYTEQETRKEVHNRWRTSSKTLLSLPLRTTTVVFGSLQSIFRACFNSGCNLSSISFIWSPPLPPGTSVGSVNAELKPCTVIKKQVKYMMIIYIMLTSIPTAMFCLRKRYIICKHSLCSQQLEFEKKLNIVSKIKLIKIKVFLRFLFLMRNLFYSLMCKSI